MSERKALSGVTNLSTTDRVNTEPPIPTKKPRAKPRPKPAVQEPAPLEVTNPSKAAPQKKAKAKSSTTIYSSTKYSSTKSSPSKRSSAAPKAVSSTRISSSSKPVPQRKYAGPHLNDWLSLALIVVAVLLAALLYHWRGERFASAAMPTPTVSITARSTTAVSADAHSAATTQHRRLSL